MKTSIGTKFNLGGLLKFTLPTMVMLLVTSLYTAVDGVFVSHFVGDDALAAINIVLPLDSLLLGVGIMLGTGGSAIIGRKLGEKREQSARENFSLITVFAVGLGAGMMVVLELLLPKLLSLMGASPRLMPYCLDYGRILIAGAVPYILQLMFQTLLVTAGKPRVGLWLSLLSGFLNLILDYLLIVPLGLGIAGAAWGTLIGRLAGGLLSVCCFWNRQEMLYFVRPKWEGSMLLRAMANGSSEMVSNIAGGVTILLFNLAMMDLLGEEGVSAISIVLYTQFLFTALFFGFSEGVAPVISYNYGSREDEYQKRLFRYCMVVVWAGTAAMVLLAWLSADGLISLFTDRESAVFPLAHHGYRLFLWNFLFAGFNMFASALFTALSNGAISALISFLRTFGFIVASILLLPRVLGVDGVWLAVPVAELGTFLVAGALVLAYGRRYHYLR